MFTICCSVRHLISLNTIRKGGNFASNPRSRRRIAIIPSQIHSTNEKSVPMDYDDSGELMGIEADLHTRNAVPGAAKLRSWFGPNGQYIRELPCPSCRGRGYTPCAECGIERSRSDCSLCNGKGIRTCRQCTGDCVIWEEYIDERPWEKVQSSSPLKMKEDEEVDKLEIKEDATRKSKRVYQSPSPEVSLKISRSLRSLNAKTGLFSKRMKIIHQDPVLQAQRVAAIKRTKGTDAARKQASDTMIRFFSDPENRLKRSIAMKGVKFYCSYCGEEGHRRHYCPTLRKDSGALRLTCRSCGERGHNRRTCGRTAGNGDAKRRNPSNSSRSCSTCGQRGHYCRTCPERKLNNAGELVLQIPLISRDKRTYFCRSCQTNGHNSRTCPNKNET